tara:strand:+ start:1164 stop:2036 length:873 start_codon:yes stop_codon:yes gene_type:complete
MKKSQLKQIIKESIKQLMNEQGLTCYTCVNSIIYSTNAFTSTMGPYHVGNTCAVTPVNQALTYISYTGNAASINGAQSTALLSQGPNNPVTELVFFDTIPGNTFFEVMGCTLPTRPDPTDPVDPVDPIDPVDPVEPTDPIPSDDPCDLIAWENHAKTSFPNLASESYPLWKDHFCEYCGDPGMIPPGTDPFCKCCKPTDKPVDIDPSIDSDEKSQLRNIIRETIGSIDSKFLDKMGIIQKNILQENECEKEGICCGVLVGNTVSKKRTNATKKDGRCVCPEGSKQVNCPR